MLCVRILFRQFSNTPPGVASAHTDEMRDLSVDSVRGLECFTGHVF